jgi:4,5-dihydroxyphthalate decarboxylase
VFTSRYFRHSCVFVNAGAGIERPADLRGKRIGVPEYQMTAAVWIRGFLEDDYGVRPTDCTWFRGGLEQTGRVEKLSIDIPGLDLRAIGEHQTLSAMLGSGELDAYLGARVPSSYDGAQVKRLFPDYRPIEEDYFRRTGIFPIMHTVVIRRELLDRHRWVARSLYDAFVAARDHLMRELADTAALHLSLPWLLPELEATRALMGDDYWPYGLEPNRRTLGALARYSASQGISARPVAIDELFAPSTLDEYRI